MGSDTAGASAARTGAAAGAPMMGTAADGKAGVAGSAGAGTGAGAAGRGRDPLAGAEPNAPALRRPPPFGPGLGFRPAAADEGSSVLGAPGCTIWSRARPGTALWAGVPLIAPRTSEEMAIAFGSEPPVLERCSSASLAGAVSYFGQDSRRAGPGLSTGTSDGSTFGMRLNTGAIGSALPAAPAT